MSNNKKNQYTDVKSHSIIPTENPKVKLVVQSLSHEAGGEPEFIDVRKFRSYDDSVESLKFTPKGVHFHKDQLEPVILGLLEAYKRIHGHHLGDKLRKDVAKGNIDISSLPSEFQMLVNSMQNSMRITHGLAEQSIKQL